MTLNISLFSLHLPDLNMLHNISILMVFCVWLILLRHFDAAKILISGLVYNQYNVCHLSLKGEHKYNTLKTTEIIQLT